MEANSTVLKLPLMCDSIKQSTRKHLQSEEYAILMLNISQIYMDRFNQSMSCLINLLGTNLMIMIVGVLMVVVEFAVFKFGKKKGKWKKEKVTVKGKEKGKEKD